MMEDKFLNMKKMAPLVKPSLLVAKFNRPRKDNECSRRLAQQVATYESTWKPSVYSENGISVVGHAQFNGC